jgi:hypothetical protein
MRASVASGLPAYCAVIFSMIIMLELLAGGEVRWLPAVAYAVILAPILLTVAAELRRRRN